MLAHVSLQSEYTDRGHGRPSLGVVGPVDSTPSPSDIFLQGGQKQGGHKEGGTRADAASLPRSGTFGLQAGVRTRGTTLKSAASRSRSIFVST
ncbi:hypothetical protein GCM10012289_40830 [Nonomuraea cavernae]|uniref:Uncharacterized protein n=1 Tax=Nonomuraea cavernae TaxID=2045107 RepID=A0A917Z1G0_9ACTN|nr:hypothetical protein GCM10012289_40830 [Nonomuraea cavernae]